MSFIDPKKWLKKHLSGEAVVDKEVENLNRKLGPIVDKVAEGLEPTIDRWAQRILKSLGGDNE